MKIIFLNKQIRGRLPNRSVFIYVKQLELIPEKLVIPGLITNRFNKDKDNDKEFLVQHWSINLIHPLNNIDLHQFEMLTHLNIFNKNFQSVGVILLLKLFRIL
jgi:hypothetical protein